MPNPDATVRAHGVNYPVAMTSNLSETLDALDRLAASGGRVRVGYQVGIKTDRPATVWAAEDARAFVASMASTATDMGLPVRFTVERVDE